MTDQAITIHNTQRTGKVIAGVQATSAMIITAFLVLHLPNILVAPFGIHAFNDVQRLLRQVYQFPPFEVLLMLAIVVHMIAAVWLYLDKRKAHRVVPWRTRLHSIAGVFLFLVIIGHIVAVRGSSFFFDVYPEFEGLSFSLWYVPAYFYPYYFLLGMAGFYHATTGLRMASWRLARARLPTVPGWLCAVFAGWLVISLASLGGLFFEVPDPRASEFGRIAGELTGLDPSRPFR